MINKKNPYPHSNSPVHSVKAALLPVAVPLNKIIPIQKIIRLSQTELAEKIEKTLQENPFLEKIITEEDHNRSSSEPFANKPVEMGDFMPSSRNLSLDEDKNILEGVNPARGVSLTGDLLHQLEWLELSPSDQNIAEVVISLVGDRGYIDPREVDQVIEEMGISRNDFNRVWRILKENLDPPGVTCEGVEDSLVFQLYRRGFVEGDLSVKIIRDFFPQLSKKQHITIAKGLGVSTHEVKSAARVIHALDPYPLISRNEGEFDNNIIVPDVVVRYREGRLEVAVNRAVVPRVRLLKDVIKESWKEKSAPSDEVKKYFDEKKVEAQTLVQALDYRESNLKRVVDYLIEQQRDFFIAGFSRLHPCKMIDVATELGIDKGSLSRLVNSKYVATDWGTFRLRDIFSLPLHLNGKDISPKIIEEKIKELITEFPDHKLTDQKLSMMLKELGLPIARRTVNKYRQRIKTR